MDNTVDIAKGLRVPSQVPLNKKEYIINETALKNLGVGDNLAFTYHKGLRVTCQEERTEYEWKEIQVGDIGLLPVNFTYPNGLISDGIDYSNKIYNFVLIKVDVPIQNNFVRFIEIPVEDLPENYTFLDVCNYVLALPAGQRTIAETDSKWNIIVLDAQPS